MKDRTSAPNASEPTKEKWLSEITPASSLWSVSFLLAASLNVPLSVFLSLFLRPPFHVTCTFFFFVFLLISSSVRPLSYILCLILPLSRRLFVFSFAEVLILK